MKEKDPVNRYSMVFKMQVVKDVEKGLLSVEEARKLYGIGGKHTVQEWINQYGINRRVGKVVYIMSDKEEHELLVLRRENRMLKKALEESQVKVITLETLIETAEEKLGVDVKKTFGAKVSEDVKRKLDTLEYPEVSD